MHFSLLLPFPGTELYINGVKKGMWKNGDPWLDFAKNPRSGFTPPVWEENLSGKELLQLTIDAYRSFYRDPAYLWRRLKRVRSVGEALRQIRTGLKILRL